MATRGRPKKVTQVTENPSSAVAPQAEVIQPQFSNDELMAMLVQMQTNMQSLEARLEEKGVSKEEAYEKPPTETTVVVEPEREAPTAAQQQKYELNEQGLPINPRTGRPFAGSVIPGTEVAIPWSKGDLDPNDVVEFSPAPVPNLVFPMEDDEGNLKILLDVNDLKCWLTVGVPNRVNRFFYNAYRNAYDQWKELEAFKRNGPEVAPWGRLGPDGRPAWMHVPFAQSFAMDIDGHALIPGSKTRVQLDEDGNVPQEGEPAEAI